MCLAVILSETKDLMHIVSFWGFSRGDFLPPFGKGGWGGDICHSEAKPKNPVGFILVILSPDTSGRRIQSANHYSPLLKCLSRFIGRDTPLAGRGFSTHCRHSEFRYFWTIKKFFYIYNIMSYPTFRHQKIKRNPTSKLRYHSIFPQKIHNISEFHYFSELLDNVLLSFWTNVKNLMRSLSFRRRSLKNLRCLLT